MLNLLATVQGAGGHGTGGGLPGWIMMIILVGAVVALTMKLTVFKRVLGGEQSEEDDKSDLSPGTVGQTDPDFPGQPLIEVRLKERTPQPSE